MKITEEHIAQLIHLIKNNGVCRDSKTYCRVCIMRGWCDHWELNANLLEKPSEWIASQRIRKAKDILIYQRVNNHPHIKNG